MKPVPSPPGRGWLLEELRSRVFGPGPTDRRGRRERVGLEVELLCLGAEDGQPVPLEAGEGPAVRPLVERLVEHRGGRIETAPTGSPRYRLPDGDAVTFEPGGQVEYASPAEASVDRAVGRARSFVEELIDRGGVEGIRFLGRGIDPENGEDGGALCVRSDRYLRLARHLERIGIGGRRMMLQTAAIHVNLDLGPAPVKRWRTANALVPLGIALFANSARHGGAKTGYRSFRAHQWRILDPLRTGIVSGPDPVEAYLDFALGAGAILLGAPTDPARPFGAWLDEGRVGKEEWRAHLTTLFPEVRPRGYLEIRCVDALPPRWYAAPVVFFAGLLLDEEACERASAVLGDRLPGEEELEAAGRDGITEDPERAHRGLALFDLALEGASRLGPEVVGTEVLDEARAYRDRFVARGEDPAGEDWT